MRGRKPLPRSRAPLDAAPPGYRGASAKKVRVSERTAFPRAGLWRGNCPGGPRSRGPLASGQDEGRRQLPTGALGLSVASSLKAPVLWGNCYDGVWVYRPDPERENGKPLLPAAKPNTLEGRDGGWVMVRESRGARSKSIHQYTVRCPTLDQESAAEPIRRITPMGRYFFVSQKKKTQSPVWCQAVK